MKTSIVSWKNIPVRFLKHVSFSLSRKCETPIFLSVLSNTIVNHHQTLFRIAFALTDCDIYIHKYISAQRYGYVWTIWFYRLSRYRYERAAASGTVADERSRNWHCHRNDIHHLRHHRCHLLLRAQDRWAGIKSSPRCSLENRSLINSLSHHVYNGTYMYIQFARCQLWSYQLWSLFSSLIICWSRALWLNYEASILVIMIKYVTFDANWIAYG